MRLALLSSLALAIAAPLQVTVIETVVTTVLIDPNTSTTIIQDNVNKNNNNATPTTTAQPTTIATSTTNDTPAPTIIEDTITPTTTQDATTESTISTSTPAATTAAATTAATTTAASGDDNATVLLNAHNAKRSLHNAPALSWDASLAAYAANYASNYDCSGTLTHSGGPYGENLALGYGIEGAVEGWYNEGTNYNYGSSCSVLDHFTQVIWKSTTKLGCAVKSCGDYWGDYVICSYDPPGNYIGQCSSNVEPPQ